MNRLPDPTQPTATRAGQPTIDTDDQRIDRIAEAFNQALAQADAVYKTPTATAFRDPTPNPEIGPTPPVPQPGRPPMSQQATDTSALMLSGSVLTVALGGAASGVLYFSGHADPTVIGLICATPIAIAVPILALSRLTRRLKETVEAAPPVIHQHYTGTVHQHHRNLNTTTRGVIATTRNQLPG